MRSGIWCRKGECDYVCVELKWSDAISALNEKYIENAGDKNKHRAMILTRERLAWKEDSYFVTWIIHKLHIEERRILLKILASKWSASVWGRRDREAIWFADASGKSFRIDLCGTILETTFSKYATADYTDPLTMCWHDKSVWKLPPEFQCPDFDLHVMLDFHGRWQLGTDPMYIRILAHRLQPLEQCDDVIIKILIGRQM